MFDQLCSSFIKDRLVWQPDKLRGDVNAITWQTILSGALDQGAAGLPGPFRQALFEICANLRAAAGVDAMEAATPAEGSKGKEGRRQEREPSLFILCPNGRSQTGDNRERLVCNPRLSNHNLRRQLLRCRIFGQLMGIAMRSTCSLELDLAETFWKQLLGHRLGLHDLVGIDFSAWQALQFCDPDTGVQFGEGEWGEVMDDLTWDTVLSDGHTSVELAPGGRQRRVLFEDRWEFAEQAAAARLNEAPLQLQSIREGLMSVVPPQALQLLGPQELELRVCGRPTVDVDVLKRHTAYAPTNYHLKHPYIQDFWKVLSEFSDEQRAQFLQFTWARSRLPSEMGTYRMQIFIIETKHDHSRDRSLPTSETCFFNVNLPHYSSIDILRQKLLQALECCTITS